MKNTKTVHVLRSFSLKKLTKQLYEKSRSWKLAIDQTVPKYLKDRIKDAYFLGQKFADSFDRRTRNNKYQIAEIEYNILIGWKYAVNVCCMSLDIANDYKDEIRRRLGTDIGEKIFQIKEGINDLKKNSSNRVLFKLLEFDPGWLLEDWAKRLILDAIHRADNYFFCSFGGAISNKQKKIYKNSTHVKHGKEILRYIDGLSTSDEIPHVPPNPESNSFLKNFPGSPKPRKPADLYYALLKDNSMDVYASKYTRKSFGNFLIKKGINFNSSAQLFGYLKSIRDAKTKYLKDVEYLSKLFNTLQDSFPSVK